MLYKLVHIYWILDKRHPIVTFCTCKDIYTTWPKKSCHFHLNQQIVVLMIWSCFSWSSLGTASQQSSWKYWMTRLSHQLIFSSLMDRALVLKEWSMNTHECQGAWVIFPHDLATTESWLYPITSLWDVLEKTEGDWRNGWNSPVINTKTIQLWMEINVGTLHPGVETMPQQMRSVIKAKGGPTKY